MPGSVGYHEAIRVWGRRGPPQVVYDQLKRVLRFDNVISWIDPCASNCRLAKLLISPKYTVHTMRRILVFLMVIIPKRNLN
jgi:hypothetical protein